MGNVVGSYRGVDQDSHTFVVTEDWNSRNNSYSRNKVIERAITVLGLLAIAAGIVVIVLTAKDIIKIAPGGCVSPTTVKILSYVAGSVALAGGLITVGVQRHLQNMRQDKRRQPFLGHIE